MHPGLEAVSQNHIASLQTSKDKRRLSFTAPQQEKTSTLTKLEKEGPSWYDMRLLQKTWRLLIPPTNLQALFLDSLVVFCWSGSVKTLDLRNLLWG
jgi:hypothetical protein